MRYTVYSSPVSALKMAVTTRDLHLSPSTTLATAIFAFLTVFTFFFANCLVVGRDLALYFILIVSVF